MSAGAFLIQVGAGNYACAESATMYLGGGRKAILALRPGGLAMVVWGCFAELGVVWATADAAMGLMALVNLVAIVMLSGVVIKLTRDYDSQLRAGNRSPRLDASAYPELGEGVDRTIWTGPPPR